MNTSRHLSSTPIATGLDYEQAREKLAALYGAAFNRYVMAKRERLSDTIVSTKLEEARSMQKALRDLRPEHGERIAAILRGE